MLGGKLGEDFSVQLKARLLQLIDERTVRSVAVLADGGIQADDPKLAEVSLLIAAVGEGITPGAHKRFVSIALLLGANAAIALSSFENVFAALLRHDASFDACHTYVITLSLGAREKTATHARRKHERHRTALASARCAALFRVEMILTLRARNEFAVTSHADSFQIRFVSFHVFLLLFLVLLE